MNTDVVLITGAPTGIGRAIASVFAQEGALSLSPVDTTKPANNWSGISASLTQRLNSYERTYATR